MTNYILGLLGTWLFCDGYISIVITQRFFPGTNTSWVYDHSIRIIRCLIGIILIIIGGLGE